MAKKLKPKNLKQSELPQISVELENGNLEITGLEEHQKLLQERGFNPGSIPIFIGGDAFDSKELVQSLLSGNRAMIPEKDDTKPKKKKSKGKKTK